jgi:hypothetical protein
MHLNNNCNQRARCAGVKAFSRRSRRRFGWALACIAVAFLTCSAQTGRQSPSPDSDKSAVPTEAPQQVRDQQTPKPAPNDARSEREKQIAEDNAKLLKLATDLKAEVDKTSIDTLSLSVIRKADEIEKLAHSVREKMKQTVGPAK